MLPKSLHLSREVLCWLICGLYSTGQGRRGWLHRIILRYKGYNPKQGRRPPSLWTADMRKLMPGPILQSGIMQVKDPREHGSSPGVPIPEETAEGTQILGLQGPQRVCRALRKGGEFQHQYPACARWFGELRETESVTYLGWHSRAWTLNLGLSESGISE